ncbi:GNAT family protein [Nocardioides sp. GY 10127]|uniref:GNAT family N-acetyltransferase n=1 Tax=Nocardioides sp. GY 10127 TaxID=2569762 RepID=UPI0010A810A6|nr:GNAT family protein [Nocardioides sp. GY 10127]TIC78692.1 GNAT family N-acetyltransferase [Nocardioides sp. GY 10127]TIC81040.1 GNAT family N-acetyltransferase [Nocardioides sp. GY 10127]
MSSPQPTRRSPGPPTTLHGCRPWPLRTPRLLLRPETPADADATWAFRRLPEVTEWIGWASTRREEYLERFLRPERIRSKLVVADVGDGRVLGDLMLAVRDGWAQAEVREQAEGCEVELGWTLHPAEQGRGLATEAVTAALAVAFEDLGARRVTASCFADNTASWRLMERVGMRRELHGRADSLHRTRGWLDGYGYALLVQEWRQARVESATATSATA